MANRPTSTWSDFRPFHIGLLARDLRSVRLSNGTAPKFLPDILGRVAARDLKRARRWRPT